MLVYLLSWLSRGADSWIRFARLQVLRILASVPVKGIAHITGGGFTDNIPRVLPSGLAAKVDMDAWQPPAIFQWLQQVNN